MPTGSARVKAHAKAFKDMQAKFHKKKQRQVKIQYLKKARKRKF